jgi:uncharacterized membrane protein
LDAVRRQLFDLVMLCLLEVTVILVAFDVAAPLRAVLVVASVLLVPGAAIVAWLDVDDLATFLSLDLAASVAVAVVLGAALLWFRWWHPLVPAAVLATVCTAVLLLDIIRITQKRNSSTEAPSALVWD